ncbi:hypothetical protein [Noviherbaspirillum sedimenti]|uniref:hypothetical protein n=1 Tax=Noviherbaspirillum sedimenti TaxID=2320865 RepID=UPI0011C47C13|nr:hypothetical protein [Noviherbaspirillum sedimenti]
MSAIAKKYIIGRTVLSQAKTVAVKIRFAGVLGGIDHNSGIQEGQDRSELPVAPWFASVKKQYALNVARIMPQKKPYSFAPYGFVDECVALTLRRARTRLRRRSPYTTVAPS